MPVWWLLEGTPSYSGLTPELLSEHWCTTPLPLRDRWMGVYSGVIRLEWSHGKGSDWEGWKLSHVVDLHLPPNCEMEIEQWTPFVTICAASDDQGAGAWAVDGFSIKQYKGTFTKAALRVNLALREGTIHRIAYQLTVVGRVEGPTRQ